MKLELQFTVKIVSQSILFVFTHWILKIGMVKTSLNSLHKLYTIIIQLVCHFLAIPFHYTLFLQELQVSAARDDLMNDHFMHIIRAQYA